MFLKNTSVLVGLGISILFPVNLHAGRPLFVDDTSPVAFQSLEIEFGMSSKHLKAGRPEHGWPTIGVAYGIYPALETGLTIRQINRAGDSHGFEDLHLTAKFRAVEETPLLPSLALDLDIKLPTASTRKGLSTGKSDQSFRTSLTKNIHPIAAHVNLGYTFVRSPSGEKLKNRIFGGAASEWMFQPDWTFVAEIFANSRAARNEANEVDFQAGLKYEVTSQLVLDAALGKSLRGKGAVVQGTVGLTWTIDTSKLFGPVSR